MITLSERVSAFINAEGHLTEVESSPETASAIRFRARGLKYTAWVMPNDNAYLQLSCGMALEPAVTFDAPLLRALWECQERFKCAKFFLEPDGTGFVCSVEQFFVEPDGYQPTFWRAIGVIESAIDAGMSEIYTKHSAKEAADKFIEELTHGGAR